jgi:hypothetical protein
MEIGLLLRMCETCTCCYERHEKVSNALEATAKMSAQETGAPVINGATSTLIAALCLAGSGSYVFVTFFYALLFIVLCGAFQGLVVLPVLLYIFNPPPHVDVHPERANSDLKGGADGPQDDPEAGGTNAVALSN